MYGGYRTDTYDLSTEQAGPGTFYFHVKNGFGSDFVSMILVSVGAVKNYTKIMFKGSENGDVTDMYRNSTDRYNLSKANIRAAYVLDDRTDTTDTDKSVGEQFTDLHIIGNSTAVISKKNFAVGEIIGGSGAVLIADGVNLILKNSELNLEFVEFRAVNVTFSSPLLPSLSPSLPPSLSPSLSPSFPPFPSPSPSPSSIAAPSVSMSPSMSLSVSISVSVSVGEGAVLTLFGVSSSSSPSFPSSPSPSSLSPSGLPSHLPSDSYQGKRSTAEYSTVG